MKAILELDEEQLIMVRDGVDLLQPDTDEAADRQQELLDFLNTSIASPSWRKEAPDEPHAQHLPGR